MSHQNPLQRPDKGRRPLSLKPLKYYLEGLGQGDQYILSECITLLESTLPEHQKIAYNVLESCYQPSISTSRIGITGSPGVGKSTFIESISQSLMSNGDRIAILTIDPTSAENKGSILGDKTRMEALIEHEQVFIRPSPSSQHLGGVHQRTLEAIIMCEAAGFNRILVETVGVGQSEIEVSSYTDITILLVQPGGGDAIQGIKKGIVEKADLIIVHKYDGDAKKTAGKTLKEYSEALQYAQSPRNIKTYSSLTKENHDELMKSIMEALPTPNEILKKRTIQMQSWLEQRIVEYFQGQLNEQIYSDRFQHELTKISSASPFKKLRQAQHLFQINLKVKKE